MFCNFNEDKLSANPGINEPKKGFKSYHDLSDTLSIIKIWNLTPKSHDEHPQGPLPSPGSDPGLYLLLNPLPIDIFMNCYMLLKMMDFILDIFTNDTKIPRSLSIWSVLPVSS